LSRYLPRSQLQCGPVYEASLIEIGHFSRFEILPFNAVPVDIPGIVIHNKNCAAAQFSEPTMAR